MIRVIVLISCLFLPASRSPAHASTFTTIDVPGASQTYLEAINSSGQIVGAYVSGNTHGFLLSGGVFTTIDFPGANVTSCQGINDSGDIVGVYILPGGHVAHGFLLQGQSFTTLDFPTALTTMALGINNAGDIVGRYSTRTNIHGFTYQAGTFTDVTISGADITELRGINNLGDVIGTFAGKADGGISHGVLISHGTQHVLNGPGSGETYTNGINDRDRIVGFEFVQTGTAGFLYIGAHYRLIANPASQYVQALGINNSLAIVGEFTDASNISHGFLRTP
jgi:hypothetical protein